MLRLKPGEKTVRWAISMPASLLDAIRKHGRGNMSHWIRDCIERELYGHDTTPRQ